MTPTHRCKVCGALWCLFEADEKTLMFLPKFTPDLSPKTGEFCCNSGLASQNLESLHAADETIIRGDR